MKPKMIWVGDATVATGFAKVTHNVLNVLKEDWEVHCIGLNYLGDPHDLPYPVYPVRTPTYVDLFGTQRLADLTKQLKPDVVVIQNDAWNIPSYLQKLEGTGVPVVASMPVDGLNCRGADVNDLSHAIFWTEFGAKEAVEGGYEGDYTVIPLGVDTDFYVPKDKVESRKIIGLPENLNEAFIVGNINRNQPRKRLDLTVSYFCQWVKNYNIHDAYLSLHTCPSGDFGYDLPQLMNYYGLAHRMIIVQPEMSKGIPEHQMVNVYNTFDVQMTTTQGEGWGLTTMEGMACGVPQVVPGWAALGEWAASPAAKVIECTEIGCTPNFINAIGGIADRTETVGALHALYVDPRLRKIIGENGYDLVHNPMYRWENIGKAYATVLQPYMEMVTT